MWYWASLQTRNGHAKPYVYYFAHAPAEPATPCGYGCGIGHGVEIQYVFDHLDWDPRAWTPEDRQLAAQLAETWVRFARSGTPDAPHLPVWPAFDGANPTIHRIGDEADLKAHGQLPDFSLFPQPPRK